mmetsp:Transcript_30102/g.36774  ORF Transcript_30102/g.36774 Transcript_30102/m.36774 type:complete len:259 (+) Transcript_30102:144-920(+)|eukprot:CAMPEP_0172486936 /NCGR_PEP_ID=MMETSP1066-20121228/15737_1 /TAXON_ID=671091 /ORGANISM="Coscinodiscus wailesii, Strain CCMP2513" /LENGTH=258 /DNA_ID=CAMNT_0013253215 /DNA_START=131 /DNA_END=907 /DNA_ORIENTATION=+
MSHNVLLEKLAQWAWGGSTPTPEITPAYCLSTLPLLPIPCLSPLITKLIGIAIIIGATLNKAPVVFNVLSTHSVTGLAVGSVYGEVIMYSNSAFYGILQNNPFTAWGENGVMTLQSWLICVLVWKYKHDPPFGASQKIVAVGVYAFYAFLAFVLLPERWHYLLLAANWPALVVARGSQIVDTFRLKHTGNHSLITTGMNLLGTVIRVFTTIKEIGWDFALLSGYLLSAVLNTVLVLQFFLYWDATVRFKKSLKEKKME